MLISVVEISCKKDKIICASYLTWVISAQASSRSDTSTEVDYYGPILREREDKRMIMSVRKRNKKEKQQKR